MAKLVMHFEGERLRSTSPCTCTDEGTACPACVDSWLSIATKYQTTSTVKLEGEE